MWLNKTTFFHFLSFSFEKGKAGCAGLLFFIVEKIKEKR